MNAAALKAQEQEDALFTLRELLPVDAVVYTVLKHCSSSGMQRVIQPLAVVDGKILDLTFLAARAGLHRRDDKRGGLVLRGCGMDMGFSLVYDIAHAVHGDGYRFTHRWL